MSAAPTPAVELEYVGFWPRLWAQVIDTAWLFPLILILGLFYQNSSDPLTEAMLRDPASISASALATTLVPSPLDFVVQFLIPAILVVWFWSRRSATPGKMAVHARIVDAKTGQPPSRRQCIIRYLGYFVSLIPFFLGMFWIGWDPRKQGWHDKLAGTVVVRPKVRPTATVSFPGPGSS